MSRCPSRGTLDAFADGQLGDHEAAQVATHLDHCPMCEGYLRQLDPLDDVLAALDAPEPPPDLLAAVRAGRRPRRRLALRIGMAAIGFALVSAGISSAASDPAIAAWVRLALVLLDDVTARPVVLRAAVGGVLIVSTAALALAARRLAPVRRGALP